MTAGTICSRVVATASPTESIRTAARRMAEHDVGTLVVLDGASRKPAGVVTDRDVAIRGVAGGLDVESTGVAEVMTSPARSVDEGTAIEDAIAEMARAGIRRLIVTGPQQRLLGILSLDDILEQLAGTTEGIGRILQKQRPSVPV